MGLTNAARILKRTIFVDHEALARNYIGWADYVRDKTRTLLGLDSDIRILDLGCGECYAVTLLFTAQGWYCTGIDVEPAWRVSPKLALSVAAKSGPRGILKRIVHEYAVVRRVQRDIMRMSGLRMPRKFDVRYMDASRMAFDDDEFDMVYSLAVLEHVQDVASAVSEMKRVMKPGAIGIHCIHLFTSLSGGHDTAWSEPDKRVPDDVRPWNHLRTGRSPSIEYLNRLRERDYRRYFEDNFEILEWEKTREGDRFLTPEIREGLSEYNEDELLTRSVNVIVRKPL